MSASLDEDAAMLNENCGVGWMLVKFFAARLFTKIEEHASNVQYMFLVRENFLTNLRNRTMAPDDNNRTNEIF